MLLFSGALARIEGNATQSYLFLDEALAVARDIGAQWLYGLGLLYSGWLARAEGNTEQAVELTQAALRVLKGTIDRESLVQALRNLGILAIEADRSRRGARLLGASEGIGNIDLVWGRLGDDPQAYAAAKLAARTTLTELEFERAWAEGRAMTPEQAMAYALEEGGD